MTRKEAGQKAKIMSAYADGKDIEYYDVISEQWINKKEPSFDDKACHYRVKVDPKYRPFKDAKECFDEMKKHRSRDLITGFGLLVLSHIRGLITTLCFLLPLVMPTLI